MERKRKDRPMTRPRCFQSSIYGGIRPIAKRKAERTPRKVIGDVTPSSYGFFYKEIVLAGEVLKNQLR